MGTRHLICIFWKGKWVLAQYGQFDGYPEGQGAKVFKFLSVAHNIENLKAGLENHIYVPTKEEIDALYDECEAFDEAKARDAQPGFQVWDKKASGINQLYPSISRDTSAGILGIIARAGQTTEEDNAEADAEKKKQKKIPVVLNLEFANTTWSCEWAYVIDLDKEVFEVFGGGEKKHAGHRFVGVGDDDSEVPAFVCSFDFQELYLLKGEDEYMDKVTRALPKRDDEDDDDNGLGVKDPAPFDSPLFQEAYSG